MFRMTDHDLAVCCILPITNGIRKYVLAVLAEVDGPLALKTVNGKVTPTAIPAKPRMIPVTIRAMTKRRLFLRLSSSFSPFLPLEWK